MEKYKWNIPPDNRDRPIAHGDLRVVNLPVECLFEWSDKIVNEVDDQGNPVEYIEGYIMTVVLGQKVVFNNQENYFVAHAKME